MTELERHEKGSIAWMARNPVTANLIMFILLAGGLIVAGRIKQEVFPEFSIDRVMVSVVYPGASPEEVEKGILLAVEEGVQGLNDVKKVISTAREGVGSVMVEMTTGGDLSQLYNNIKNEE